MYSDLFSDLTQNMASQPIGRSQELRNLWRLLLKRMEFQFRWQLITNHSVLARSRNVQITGVAGLIHPCYIVNPYQTWNQTYSVWSRFQGIPSGVHNRKFNGIFALVREDCDDGMFCSETWLSSRNIECACDRREKTSFSFSFPWLSFQPILTLQRCTLTFENGLSEYRFSCMMFRWRFHVHHRRTQVSPG